MLCPLCESQNPDSSLRCRACGAKLGAREIVAQNDSPDALPVGSVLGRLYSVEGVLGQGGFGITYRCRDQMLERAVAVKEFFPSNSRRAGKDVEPGRGFSTDEFREARAQFLIEARLLARCHHPGVVMVHTAFEENGTAYMVMELLHGQNLMQATDARGESWSESEALAPIERVGQALQYVHDQGLLHRDIKPENIVLCDDGRVMLLDFGTAREYAQGQSQRHTVAVTPGFAPLEQYAKQAKRGAFTDVYGLAATLYYLLTGAPPPAASDRAMGVVVRPVREQNPRVSEVVASAVEAGLHMEIARRPQSVREFLGLLRASASETSALTEVENGASLQSANPDFLPPNLFATPATRRSPAPFAPVALRPRDADAPKPSLLRPPASPPSSFPSTSYQPNWTPPHSGGGIGVQDPDDRNGVMFGLLIGIPLLLFLAFAFTQKPAPSYPPSPIVWTNDPSLPNYRPNFDSPPGSGIGSSSPSVAPTAVVDTAPEISPLAVQKLPVSGPAKAGSVAPHFYQLGLAEFSPNGKWMAYRDSQNVIRVWDRSARRIVRTMPQATTRPVYAMAFSSSGNFLTLTHAERSVAPARVVVWNFRTGKMLGKLDFSEKKDYLLVNAARPDGQVLLSNPPLGTGNGISRASNSLWLWNPRTGKKNLLPVPKSGGFVSATFSPDGKKLVVGHKSGQISWLDTNTGALKAQRNTTLTVREFAATLGNESFSITLKPDDLPSVLGLRFSSNGSFVASQNLGQIHVFDRNNREVAKTPEPFSFMFALSPDGRSIVDGTISNVTKADVRLSTVDGKQTQLLIPNSEGKEVGAVSFSLDGKQVQAVLSSSEGTSLYTWPVGRRSQSAAPVIAPSSTTENLGGYSPSGSTSFGTDPNAMLALSDKYVASSNANYAEVRRTNGSFSKQFIMNMGMENLSFPREFALSRDGRLLGVRGPTGKTQIWTVETGRPLIDFKSFPPLQSYANTQNQNRNILFSPDNRLVAFIGINETREFVELWTLQPSPRRLALIEQDAPVSALAFSLDGGTVLVGHQDGTLQWIDVETQRVIARSVGGSSQGRVSAIFASTNGCLVVRRIGAAMKVARYDGTPSPRDSNARSVASMDEPFPSAIIGDAAVFSRDGRILAVPTLSAFGNSICLWSVATGAFLQELTVSRLEGAGWLRTTSLAFSADGNRIFCLQSNPQTSRAEVMTWQRSASRQPGF